MKNNFKENGNIRIRYETPEEKASIIRALEKYCRFRIRKDQKDVSNLPSPCYGTFDINIKRRSISYGIQPFIGAAMMTSGVRFYSAQEFCRIAELGFTIVPRFPVFHEPHNGDKFPYELMDSVNVSKRQFMQYHDLVCDNNIGMLVPRAYYGGHMHESFEISPLLCDVEKYISPGSESEPDAKVFCSEKAFDGKKIINATDETVALSRKYYDEYQSRMKYLCDSHPRILLFDIRSFSEVTVPDQLRGTDKLPDVCIGTNAEYTPEDLTERIRHRLDELNLISAENIPYSGTFIPDCILDGSSTCNLVSVMLAFNRDLIYDKNKKPIESGITQMRNLVHQILVDCVDLE